MCDRAKKPTSIAVDRFSHCNNFNTLFQRIYKNFCFRFVKSLTFIRSHFCRTRKTTELRTNSLSYPRDALPPPHRSNLFNFMQFLSKISQNNRFASTLLGLAPPLKNPESATATFGPTGFPREIVSGYVFRSVNRIRNRLKPFQIIPFFTTRSTA